MGTHTVILQKFCFVPPLVPFVQCIDVTCFFKVKSPFICTTHSCIIFAPKLKDLSYVQRIDVKCCSDVKCFLEIEKSFRCWWTLDNVVIVGKTFLPPPPPPPQMCSAYRTDTLRLRYLHLKTT